VLEVNPRASRTIPLFSKAIGCRWPSWRPLGDGRGQAGKAWDLPASSCRGTVSVKEAVFPFVAFPVSIPFSARDEIDGEVMGIDMNCRHGVPEKPSGRGNVLPLAGNVFVSVRDSDKAAVRSFGAALVRPGVYRLFHGRHRHGPAQQRNSQSGDSFASPRARPHVLDMIQDKQVGWIVNTPSSGEFPGWMK